MRKFNLFANTLLVFMFSVLSFSQASNLEPKYGGKPKTESQKAADEAFIKAISAEYKGDRKKASQAMASRGWDFLKLGNLETAMNRFNQAWLLDNSNAVALWGMAAILGNVGKLGESVKLFEEAVPSMSKDDRFLTDYARALAMAGTEGTNKESLNKALKIFEEVYKRSPRLGVNLENWAIALFYAGNYEESWKKVGLAEGVMGKDAFDKDFIIELEKKLRRPK